MLPYIPDDIHASSPLQLNPKWAAAMAAQGSGGAFKIS
jgi:cobalamin biosynthesis Mg chelatase CobN